MMMMTCLLVALRGLHCLVAFSIISIGYFQFTTASDKTGSRCRSISTYFDTLVKALIGP